MSNTHIAAARRRAEPLLLLLLGDDGNQAPAGFPGNARNPPGDKGPQGGGQGPGHILRQLELGRLLLLSLPPPPSHLPFPASLQGR